MEEYDKAEKYLELLGNLSKDKKLLTIEVLDYLRHSRDLYLKKKDFEKAFDFQGKYVALKDSIQGKDVQNKLNDLNVKYETEKKEHQNKLLLKEKDAVE